MSLALSIFGETSCRVEAIAGRRAFVELEAQRRGLRLAPQNAVTTDEPSFVPQGIDADSWVGFEQRIQQRRFHALIDTARQALAAGDRPTAVSALTEARELNPDAEELTALEVQAATHAGSRRWKHPPRIVAMLAVGAAVLLALNTLRDPVEAPAAPSSPVLERSVPAPAPAATNGVADAPVSADPLTPAPSAAAPTVPQEPLPPRVAPLTDEGRVAFALKRYARTFTGYNFADCAITMRTMAATAVCRTAGEIPIWDVELSLHDEGWLIDSAIAREK
jgi:hypothetical protein